VYIGGIRGQIEQVTTLLNLPKFVLPLFGICIGHPAQDPDIKPRLPKALIFFENNYQSVQQPLIDEYNVTMANYYQQRSSNQKISNWSENIEKVLNSVKRDTMLDYLYQQGWINQ
ncbi:MAG: hypothetical protein J6562_07330, partial [Candidatus Schmidhempelia sp.]|nr:hypothetical protein [Candidatus Schmidhempelia sp.]